MRHVVSRTLAVFAIVLAAGCASSGAGKSDTPPGYKQPTLMSGGTHPDLRFGSSGTDALSVTIDVMVDSTGTPDLKTLKLSGTGAEANRFELETWLSQVTFKPATVNGVPVAGPFNMTIKAKKTIMRVR